MFLILFIFISWLTYMFFTNQWYLFLSHGIMSLVMVAGSFIAGASPESGGAFAFPVMTLLYNFSPSVIRNFSLAIQSIGMTSASFYIYKKKIPIDKSYLYLSTIGGAIGIIIWSQFFRNIGSPEFIKMLFFSFWLSFAFVLFYLNHIKKREVKDSLPNLNRLQKSFLILVGIIGGFLTSILGSGIDIFTFSYVTMRYNLSEKVATPTSVIIMAVNSIVGFLIHLLIQRDFGNEEFKLLKVCIPIVIFGAPLGVYFVNKIKRTQIANFLYIILLTQFVIAWAIIKPRGDLLIFSIIIFFSGIVIFSLFGKVILFTAVLGKILVPERFSGRTFAWDSNKTVGFDIGLGFWKNIAKRKYFFLMLFFIWLCLLLLFTKGDVSMFLISPIPVILIIISVFASVIANATAAGGGIIFLPAFSFIFLGYLNQVDIAQSYFLTQAYTLSGIVIAIHATQAFGMLAGSISWWSSGVKILIKENVFNVIGVIAGVIIGKYYWEVSEDIIYNIFGITNLLMSFVIIYNLVIIKNIPTRTNWPNSLSWIFFFVGITGGLLSAWTSIGIGSLTSFILILLLKPEIGIANGSILMALTSMITLIVHIIIKQAVPIEIILFTIPAVLFGGYAAPFFGMWVGKKFYRFMNKLNPSIAYDGQGKRINSNILEYTSGQLIMSISFIVVCLYNGIYYLIIK